MEDFLGHIHGRQGMGRCFHTGGHPRPLSGRNPDGSWATAAAKQYPPRFCELLAAGAAAAFS
eukprot:1313201-Lingulodinium_polyedra.AAC.1